MLNISKDELAEIKNNFKDKKVAIVGDMMLDCYFWGDVKRISPEAPVPVVEVDNEFFRFGGAANCAYNIIKLGGIPVPIGVIGNDNDGKEFKLLMEDANINPEGIIADDGRPTTAKTRVIADNHHIVRIDRETKNNISPETEEKIIEFFKSKSKELDAVILQDYNKGVLTKKVISEIIRISNENNIIITVDPKFNNFFEFKDVTLFKPNKKETEDALGIRIDGDEDVENAGRKLLDKLNSKYALLTLGEDGVALFEKSNGSEVKRISTKARKVRDVSGAGDTVISTLTLALAAKTDIAVASYLANYAAGIVCEEVGIVPIELDKLFDTVNSVLK